MSEGIKQYTTLIAHTCDGLDKQVNDYIEEGWEPYGSPYIIPNVDGTQFSSQGPITIFCQAVVKKITFYGGIGGGR